MKIVTMDDDDHNVLLQPSADVIFPLTKADKQFIEEFTSFFYQLDEEAGIAGLAATQYWEHKYALSHHRSLHHAA